MITRKLRILMTKPLAIVRPWFFALELSTMLVLSVVLLGQVSHALEVFPNKPDADWTYPPDVSPNQGGNFAPTGPAAIGPDGTVYVAGKLYGYPDSFTDNYYLFGFLPASGTMLWKKQLTFRKETASDPLIVTSPTVTPKGVIYIGADHKLYALNPDSSVKWQYDTGEARLTMAAVAFDGTIYIGAGNQLLALTPEGINKWAFTFPTAEWPASRMSEPAIGADGTIYITTVQTLYALKPDGSEKWQYSLSDSHFTGSPVIGADGTIYIVFGYYDSSSDVDQMDMGELHAVSPAGLVKWTYPLLGSPYDPVIGSSGDLYLGTSVGSCGFGGSCSGMFYAIKQDGNLKWKLPPLPDPVTSVAAVGYYERIIFRSGGDLYAVRGFDGYIEDTFQLHQTGGADPVVDLYGHIYFGANHKFWAVANYMPGPARSSWPLVRQGLRQTGSAEELAKIWEFTVANPARLGSAFAVARDGTIYLNSGCQFPEPSCSNLYAIKPDGQKKWEFNPGPDIRADSCKLSVGPDGTVYVVAIVDRLKGFAYPYLFAIGPDGTKKWTFQVDTFNPLNPLEPPTFGPDGTVYLATPATGFSNDDGKLYAINPLNGNPKWEYELGGVFGSRPVVGMDGTIYVTGAGENDGNSWLHAIKPDGTLRWKVLLPYPVHTVLLGGTTLHRVLYAISTINDRVLALELEVGTPETKWVRVFSDNLTASPTIGADGTLYAPVGGRLHALKKTTGETQWQCDFFKTPFDDYELGSPTVGADGTIYIIGFDGFDSELWAVNSNPFVSTVKWSFKTSPGGKAFSSSPAIGPDGTVYVTNDDGKLYALKSFSGGLAASAWPMEDHDLQRSRRQIPTVCFGSAIFIELADPNLFALPTNILFDLVLQAGWVSLTTPTEMVDSPPPGYLNVDPPFVREIETTADYQGSVEVCFDISQLQYFKRENLCVFHWEIDAWVDRTSPAPAVELNRLCSSVESLSQFAIFQPGTFTGFFPPVSNLPKLNKATAGQSIPVKFSLGDDQGLNIFTADYPKSQQINCSSEAPLDDMAGMVSTGKSSLSYDAASDQYVYVWKTNKLWAGTCRQLVVKLNDGSEHHANFRFK